MDPPSEPGKVGVAYLGAGRGQDAWSGIPFGLASGLERLGVAPTLFDVDLPQPLMGLSRRWGSLRYGNRHAGAIAPGVGRARRIVARARARTNRHLGDWVYCGRAVSEAPRLAGREVLLADMTVVQARGVEATGFAGLPGRLLDAMAERQAARYRSAVGCCVASEWARQSAIDAYGVPPERVHVVGFGRNMNPRPVDRDWTDPRFLFVGHDWERKNGPAVVRAFARLRSSLGRGTLDLVGGHPSVDVPGVRGHGRLTLADPAARRRLEHLFEQATCFVMPSRFEAFGIVYAEAGVAGVPSIGTTRGGAATAVGSGGVLVDPDDDDALLAAMEALVDPERARALGSAARENARRFTWEAVAERVLAAFDAEGAGPRSGPAPQRST